MSPQPKEKSVAQIVRDLEEMKKSTRYSVNYCVSQKRYDAIIERLKFYAEQEKLLNKVMRAFRASADHGFLKEVADMVTEL